MENVEAGGIGIIAHDLKEPLATVRQLSLGLDVENLEEVRAQLVDTSEAALRQVNDLVKLARLGGGAAELEPVAAGAVCDEVAAELHYLYRENHKSLATDCRAKNTLAVANREMLHSIIYNFCTNALHYADAETAAELKVLQKGGRVRVAVRDRGPALPAKIWRELQKGWLDQPTAIAMRPGSSGLGLYIASRFARSMAAEIGAVRHRDGTSFYIDLPVSKQLALL